MLLLQHAGAGGSGAGGRERLGDVDDVRGALSQRLLVAQLLLLLLLLQLLLLLAASVLLACLARLLLHASLSVELAFALLQRLVLFHVELEAVALDLFARSARLLGGRRSRRSCVLCIAVALAGGLRRVAALAVLLLFVVLLVIGCTLFIKQKMYIS